MSGGARALRAASTLWCSARTSAPWPPRATTAPSGCGTRRRAPLGQPLTGHDGAVLTMAFSPDGKTLAAGSGDVTLGLGDAADAGMHATA
ncbi:WD40 repeat domain-containing protein [Actinomadura nitritigenes]|uniref:WD40 repeat domain-containing protein n=1 Tax=Actinomadura nitritigenes TaxID=134602 RepID=UPI003D8E6D55